MNQFRRWLWVMFSFQGRISRREYWLMGWLGMVALVGIFFGPAIVAIRLWPQVNADEMLALTFWLLVFALNWAFFALCIKRVRDTGRSGWLVLLVLIPFLGWVLPVLWGIEAGEEGEAREEAAS